jgi:hypothetical protein
MKKTRRAKSVKVHWEDFKVISKISEYQCPCCKTIFRNTIGLNTTRFYCDCGQELIVT